MKFYLLTDTSQICTSYRTVQSTIWTICKYENISVLYEEPGDNLFPVNILFFICKSFYDVIDIDVTKHIMAMVVTASKTSKSYVINQFHFQRSNFTFL